MSEEKDIENIDSLNDAEQEQDNLDLVDDDKPSLEDYIELKEKADKLEETNKKLYARLKNSSQSNKTEPLKDDSWKERIELKVEGYSDAEVDFILRNGGKKGLENDFVKKAIEVKREQLRAEQALVSEDTSKSDIEKKYTQDQLKNMSTEDLEKLITSGKA